MADRRPRTLSRHARDPGWAEQRLSDVVLAEIGAVMGRYPASVLISTDPTKRNYQVVASEVVRRAADFARTAYGIDVVSVDVRRLYPPELNREHVFERMKAERAKIAKENRSAGEVEAKRIIAEADHEKSRINSDAAGRAERVKAKADAEASRTYAAAFGQIRNSPNSSGPCGPTTSCWMTRRLSFFPQTPTLCGCCTSTSNRAGRTVPSGARRIFNRRRSSAEQKTRGGGPMTLASDQALVGNTRREADLAAKDLTRGVENRGRVPDYRASLGVAIAIGSSPSLAFFWEPIWPRASISSGQTSARWCVGSVPSRPRSAPAYTTASPGPLIAWTSSRRPA